MSAFDEAFVDLIGSEGGYSNNPKDPGGETMWGITARVARANGYDGPMRQLPLDLAKSIARKLYWDPLRLDEFDPVVAGQILDANYNGGHPIIWMQGASGAKVDGILGPKTVAAVKAIPRWQFLLRWNSLRLRYYTSLRRQLWQEFGRGWANRIADKLWKGGV